MHKTTIMQVGMLLRLCMHISWGIYIGWLNKQHERESGLQRRQRRIPGPFQLRPFRWFSPTSAGKSSGIDYGKGASMTGDVHIPDLTVQETNPKTMSSVLVYVSRRKTDLTIFQVATVINFSSFVIKIIKKKKFSSLKLTVSPSVLFSCE